ncbi:MAG: HPr family phosphocarrier protein [Clostridia bacterium]|nr:HPr family phosphocarrier protein [Clostridia bacterium]
MLEKTLILSNIDDVKSFVELANTKDYDIEIMSGKYVVNAKSIMGIFSLDLTKPVVMVAHCGEKIAEISRQVEKYTIEAKQKKEQ